MDITVTFNRHCICDFHQWLQTPIGRSAGADSTSPKSFRSKLRFCSDDSAIYSNAIVLAAERSFSWTNQQMMSNRLIPGIMKIVYSRLFIKLKDPAYYTFSKIIKKIQLDKKGGEINLASATIGN